MMPIGCVNTTRAPATSAGASGTVFQPRDEPASAAARLFSYETSYDALAAQCDPSYMLEEGETGFIVRYVTDGYTVVMPDYEGEDAAYGAGQQSSWTGQIPAYLDGLARGFGDLIMSRTGTPRGPLFIGNGLSDTIGDGVTVTKDVQELAYTYCHRGVPVEFHIAPVPVPTS
jgi:Secretory lipase